MILCTQYFALRHFCSGKELIKVPFKDCKATIVAVTLSSHNSAADGARELFKPSNDL